MRSKSSQVLLHKNVPFTDPNDIVYDPKYFLRAAIHAHFREEVPEILSDKKTLFMFLIYDFCRSLWLDFNLELENYSRRELLSCIEKP